MRHSVQVAASSLYEAAVLAIEQFRASALTDVAVGKGTRLAIAVSVEAESHEVSVAQVENWLQSMGKSPKEQALKSTLRQRLSG
jgi:hypothetical protein